MMRDPGNSLCEVFVLILCGLMISKSFFARMFSNVLHNDHDVSYAAATLQVGDRHSESFLIPLRQHLFRVGLVIFSTGRCAK